MSAAPRPPIVRALRRSTVRIALLAPLAATMVYGVVARRVAEPTVFVVLAVAALGAVLLVASRTRPEHDDRTRRHLWFTGSAVLVGLMAPFLLLAMDVNVERFAPLVAIACLGSGYDRGRWPRALLAVWTLVVWGGILVLAGVTDLPVLVLHLGGSLLVIGATFTTADILGRATAEAAGAREDAERRAGLLATVLQTNSLDPAQVLHETVVGLGRSGFDVATIREVDRGTGVARLVAHWSVLDPELPDELALTTGLVGEVVDGRREVVVDDLSADPELLPHLPGAKGLVLVPLLMDGQVTAMLGGASLQGSLQPVQLETARLLARQAERALVRARTFEADQRTVEELRHLDARTHDFVSTVSHELRTPLTVIHGLGQTLLRRWDDVDPQRRTDLLQRIDGNAARLARMVRSLLDSSALEHGSFELHCEPVALHALVSRLLHRLATVTAAHPVEVTVAPDLEVDVDPALLEHVVENLLTNVAKHTPQGTRVTIGAEHAGDEVEISVTDEGPGIPAEDLPHVLDRFYRGGEPDRRAVGGLGLGLSLASQIVEAHGSRLEIDSVEGEGTRFSFRVRAAS